MKSISQTNIDSDIPRTYDSMLLVLDRETKECMSKFPEAQISECISNDLITVEVLIANSFGIICKYYYSGIGEYRDHVWTKVPSVDIYMPPTEDIKNYLSFSYLLNEHISSMNNENNDNDEDQLFMANLIGKIRTDGYTQDDKLIIIVDHKNNCYCEHCTNKTCNYHTCDIFTMLINQQNFTSSLKLVSVGKFQ